jgi:hypothetical protein
VRARVPGLAFDTYDLLILVLGVLSVLADAIAFASLRRADSGRTSS